jgi:hypothetical protein
MPSNITRWHDFPSNFSNGTSSVEGIGSLFQYANIATGNLLGIVIVVLTFAIAFVVMKGNNGIKAFTAASFISLLISILLLRIDMIALPFVFALALIFIVGLIMTRSESERGLL